jgi:hypothetical protein
VEVKLAPEAATGVHKLETLMKNFKAAMGLLITRDDTQPAPKDLLERAGTFHSDVSGRDFPRIQARTIGELLVGKGFDLPAPLVEDGRTPDLIPLEIGPSI